MSVVPTNNLFKEQNRKLIPSSFKKAVISSVNAQTFTADVYFVENPGNIIKSLPLASQIDPSQVLPNDRCRVDVFDETNPRDMVVAYIYGRFFPAKQQGYPGVVTSNGTALFLPARWTSQRNATGDYTVIHNLGTLNYAVVVVAESGLSPMIATVVTKQSNFFEVIIKNTSSTATDDQFSFIAMLKT